jgi:hypothetical protein
MESNCAKTKIMTSLFLLTTLASIPLGKGVYGKNKLSKPRGDAEIKLQAGQRLIQIKLNLEQISALFAKSCQKVKQAKKMCIIASDADTFPVS